MKKPLCNICRVAYELNEDFIAFKCALLVIEHDIRFEDGLYGQTDCVNSTKVSRVPLEACIAPLLFREMEKYYGKELML